MSGESPNAHRNDMFDFGKEPTEGRSSPATTSKDVGVQSSSGVVTASVMVEPHKEEDPREGLNSPILNKSLDDVRGSRRNSDADRTVALVDNYKDKDDDGEKRKLNGDADKLDGVWVPQDGGKIKEDEESESDENCVVKCLYYSMQCCDCSIM